MSPDINYLAVIAATVSSIVLGFAWYGPLFGKPWMKLMGFTPESMEKAKAKNMNGTYAIMMASSFVMAYVLAHVTIFAMSYTQTYGIMGGLMSGFWNWLGFVAPVMMGAQLWEGKPWKLFWIQAGYYLVSLLIQGVILATWT